MLTFDQTRRITALDALKSPYFDDFTPTTFPGSSKPPLLPTTTTTTSHNRPSSSTMSVVRAIMTSGLPSTITSSQLPERAPKRKRTDDTPQSSSADVTYCPITVRPVLSPASSCSEAQPDDDDSAIRVTAAPAASYEQPSTSCPSQQNIVRNSDGKSVLTSRPVEPVAQAEDDEDDDDDMLCTESMMI